MDQNVNIISNFNDFLTLVDKLYNEIVKAQNIRKEEYIAIGKHPPKRIRYEELDLSKYMHELLSVHKTLQSRNHNYRLGKEGKKARLIAIAGVCEFIKNEYLGRFWDSYENLIGWSSDNTVYNWIWGKGFKEIGINLIRSYSGRREFVQTLILESGIPNRRIGDIIDFFIIYRRYFSNEPDIENLVKNIASGENVTRFLNKSERQKIYNICVNAIDYTHAFSIIIYKLSKVFDFIESSDTLYSSNILDSIDIIYNKTGIHPLEILRDEKQLLNLYNKLLGYVTPAKLLNILSSQSFSTAVLLPSGKTIQAGRYKYPLYGEHKVGGITFNCVPSPRVTLKELEQYPFNRLLSLPYGFLFKSKSKLNIYVDNSIRYNLSRSFYTSIENRITFRGNIFCSPGNTTNRILIKDDKDNLLHSIDPNKGITISASLTYEGNFERNNHGLKIIIDNAIIYEPELKGQKLQLTNNRKEDKKLPFKVLNDGFGRIKDRYILLNNPMPCKIRLNIQNPHDLSDVKINDKSYRVTKYLDRVMLFSPSTEWKISPIESTSLRFGYKYFVLFIDEGIKNGNISTSNLDILNRAMCGSYSVLSLAWVDNKENCSIQIDSGDKIYKWEFDQYVEIDLNIIKLSNGKYHGLILNNKFGISLKEFGISLSPRPYSKLKDSLFWNIIIDDNPPIVKRINDGPSGTDSENSIIFDSKDFLSIIGAGTEYINTGISRIEISLCTEDIILASDKIWIFSDLKIIQTGILNEGDQVNADLIFNNNRESLVYQDESGSSTAKINIDKKNETFRTPLNSYSTKINLENSAIELKSIINPRVRGVRLLSNTTNQIEALRDLFKRELKNYTLLLLAYSSVPPSFFVNGQKVNIQTIKHNNLLSLELEKFPNLVLSENKIKVILSDLTVKFRIPFRLLVDKINLNDTIVENYLFGSVIFAGPNNSGIKFIVYQNDISDKNIITEKLLKYDGIFTDDKPTNFQIKIDKSIPKSSDILVKLNLIPDLNRDNTFYEYGRIWTISRAKLESNKVFKVLVEESHLFYNEGKFFRAKELLAKAEKVSTKAENASIKDLSNSINSAIYKKSINTLSQQVLKILQKEYVLKF